MEARSQNESSSPKLRLREARVGELLDVALEEFLGKGLEGASLGAIARRAGASKTTFYSRFPTKERLFLAVLQRHMDQVFGKISVTLPPDPPLQTTLREYGNSLANHLSSPQHIGLFRLIVMEAARFPELSRRYLELGSQRSHAVLANYFAVQIQRGRLAKVDPDLLAENFLNLLTGSLRFIIHGFVREFAAEDAARRVDGAVEVFLRAYSSPNEISKGE